MEKRYWFVPKSYGWGLIPTCWQGWIVTLIYAALIVVYLGFGYGLFENVEMITTSDVLKMIFDIFVSGVVFVYMMDGKTDGKVRWYWGNIHKE